MEIKLQLKPRDSVAKEDDPKPSHQLYKLHIKSTWSTSRLCAYGIYKRTLRAPTKENTLVLIAVYIGGKNTQQYDQIRVWAAPTACPETNTVLEDTLEGRDGRWLPERKRMLTEVTQEKYLLFLYFDLFCSFLDFFFFFGPPLSVEVVVSLILWNLIKFLSFFFLTALFILVSNLCLYTGFFCGVFLSFSSTPTSFSSFNF